MIKFVGRDKSNNLGLKMEEYDFRIKSLNPKLVSNIWMTILLYD